MYKLLKTLKNYRNQTLSFHDDQIISNDTNKRIMMSWEAPLMKKSAEYICENGGDILELGFGMGICADYIQSQDIKSHTIVEIHPQIIEKLNEWAKDKSNVIVIEGDWFTAPLATYDGIFLDTFEDVNIMKFRRFAQEKSNDSAKITYFHPLQKKRNVYRFDNISWGYVDITPSEHNYSKITSRYYIPKVIL
tara:strand:+ start:710 stop:1285 length:576 start_codon:yes stop_codon:yes gene_type:complete